MIGVTKGRCLGLKLFQAGKIGKLKIKNRIVMAPMGIGGLAEPDGRISQRGIDYYVERAKGGVGLITTGVVRVHRWLEQPTNLPLVRHLMADDKLYITRLNELADSIHDHGAKLSVQVTAGLGRVAGPEYLSQGNVVSASESPCFWDSSILTRQMTIDEIKQLVKKFEIGAEILCAAGIDAIELHGHEGYLFDQFMTSVWNRRKDEYGGSLDGRLKFALDIIKAIKRGAGNDFPIIYRLGLTHYLQEGRGIEEGLEICRRLEKAGVHAIHVDAGCYETWYWAHPPTTQPPGCMVDMAEKVKKKVNIPVMAVGKLGYVELAEKILEKGIADFIVLGRQLLADPAWPKKVKSGKLEDIRPCIGDHECLKRILGRKYLSCAVRPATGMEREFKIRPSKTRKNVLVIGGGPAGMEAARVCSLRGHNVTLWDKNKLLGGNLIPASIPKFKKDYKAFIDYLSNQIRKLGVQIELKKEATSQLISELSVDVIFFATGSVPLIPKILGIDAKRICTAVDALTGRVEVGSSLGVIGGGLIGCETALHFAQAGREIVLLEMSSKFAADMYSANRMHLLKLLSDAKVRMLLNARVLEIANEEVFFESAGEPDKITVDNVILATGVKSNRVVFDKVKNTMSEAYTIGDCAKPGKVIDAIWDGFRKGRLI